MTHLADIYRTPLEILRFVDRIFDRDGLQEMRGLAWNDSERELLQSVIRGMERDEEQRQRCERENVDTPLGVFYDDMSAEE